MQNDSFDRKEFDPAAIEAVELANMYPSDDWPRIELTRWLNCLSENIDAAEACLGHKDKQIRVAIYGFYIRAHAATVLPVITQERGYSKPSQIKEGAIKLQSAAVQMAEILQRLRYTRMQPKNLSNDVRDSALAALHVQTVVQFLESILPNEVWKTIEPEVTESLNDPFNPDMLANGLQKFGENYVGTVAHLVDQTKSPKVPHLTTEQFIFDMADLWSLFTSTKPTAGKNTNLENYHSKFVEFVHAAWNSNVLGSFPSDDTLDRSLKRRKLRQDSGVI